MDSALDLLVYGFKTGSIGQADHGGFASVALGLSLPASLQFHASVSALLISATFFP